MEITQQAEVGIFLFKAGEGSKFYMLLFVIDFHKNNINDHSQKYDELLFFLLYILPSPFGYLGHLSSHVVNCTLYLALSVDIYKEFQLNPIFF